MEICYLLKGLKYIYKNKNHETSSYHILHCDNRNKEKHARSARIYFDLAYVILFSFILLVLVWFERFGHYYIENFVYVNPIGHVDTNENVDNVD